MESTHHPRVLILGGGYAGMLTAARVARGGRAQVTLVDQREAFVQRIRMHELLAGASMPQLAYGPALNRRGVAFLQACAERIDIARQEVSLTPQAPLLSVLATMCCSSPWAASPPLAPPASPSTGCA